MKTIYKYLCECGGGATYVEWNSKSPETMPCCSECGSKEEMKYTGEVFEIE
ncbi:hypothetical protein [Tumebacillus permanentifrigoris]|uniref:FmdB family regulatory protein n=1 Tax=Tumebacillus permanentifrigoris TaxID=378543 RepID=A0A316D7F7_9BACL|nr:hypothetical protein [Tumebacillus permanentifrigoris]PWK10205.1 hypothetical protein C7459_11226 [Tumebacillus permanentifrigoris]